MPRHWQQVLIAVAAFPLALLLAGCEIAGTVDVRPGPEVVADLTFTKAAVDCLGLSEFGGLAIRGTPDADGNQLCRAQGTVDLQELRKLGIQVTQLGEYVTVDVAMPQSFGYTPTKIDIRFPGPVVDPGETIISGNEVRLNTGTGIATISPTRIVAKTHSGPDWWVLAGAGGVAAGAVLAVAAMWLVRRARRSGDSAAPTVDIPAEGPNEEVGNDSRAPASGQARDAAGAPTGGGEGAGSAAQGPGAERADAPTGADYEALFAPPPAGGPAVPPTRTQPAPAPATEAVEADHSIWGPPEDQRGG